MFSLLQVHVPESHSTLSDVAASQPVTAKVVHSTKSHFPPNVEGASLTSSKKSGKDLHHISFDLDSCTQVIGSSGSVTPGSTGSPVVSLSRTNAGLHPKELPVPKGILTPQLEMWVLMRMANADLEAGGERGNAFCPEYPGSFLKEMPTVWALKGNQASPACVLPSTTCQLHFKD